MLRTSLLALTVALAPVAAIPANATTPAASETAPVTQMDHISIQKIGHGAPVILIPGLSSPRAVWDGVAPEIARTHTVYLVQVNGFAGGDGGANLKPGLLDGIVADLHSYITTNKLQGAAVVGHSMGGLVSLMLAKAHPDDAGKLMIVDSLPFIGAIFLPNATVAMLEPRAAMLRDQMKGAPISDAQATATAKQLALKPQSQKQVFAWVKATNPAVSAEAMYEDMTTDLRPDMAAIKTPITLVYPWNDTMPQARADAFYKGQYAKAPNVTFVGIGDSAHFVMLDQPQAFAKALDAFLAK